MKKVSDETSFVKTNINPEDLGEPGLHQWLHAVAHTADDAESRGPNDLRNPERRQFHAWARLLPQSPVSMEQQVCIGPQQGRTRLIAPREFGMLCRIESDDQEANLVFRSNEEGLLASVEGYFEANDWQQGLDQFRRLASPVLSQWSFVHGVPISMVDPGIHDLDNGIQHQSYVSPYIYRQLILEVGHEERLGLEFRSAFAFYREGLTSGSPAYRLLCFYKMASVLKALEKSFRNNAVPKHMSHKDFAKAVLVTIQDSDLAFQVWPESAGRSLSRLLDQTIRPLRNEIAHELAGDGETFSHNDEPELWNTSRQASDALVALLRRWAYALSDVRPSALASK